MSTANNQHEPKRERIDWSDVPIVYVTVPTCHYCGSPDYTTTKSEANGDGTTTLKSICRLCEMPFKICRELPEFGNDDEPIE